jgi:hypothetical protein
MSEEDNIMHAATGQSTDKRCRSVHPERITVGDKVYERNDVVAERLGETERTLNKRDRNGAPRQFFGGVKYRPLPDFDEFITSGIVRQPPLVKRKRGRA